MGLISMGAMALGAILGLFVGALVGGNFAPNLQLFGLQGYEATGILGLGVGLLLGAFVAARWTR